jgi:hypothetical protein
MLNNPSLQGSKRTSFVLTTLVHLIQQSQRIIHRIIFAKKIELLLLDDSDYIAVSVGK